MRTRLVIGSPVRGSDLWDRQGEIEEIWRILQRDHVLLVAPRRFGKTSIMLNLRDKPLINYKVLYLDTEWIKDPADFIAELATELLKDNMIRQVLGTVGGVFSSILNRIHTIGITDYLKLELREEIARDWHDKGKQLIGELKGFDGRIVVIVDELCLMIQRILRKGQKDAEDFLFWMRGVRQMPELSNVRFVIGGSIGIEHVLKKAGTGTKAINDLRRIQVGPFSEKEAHDFIEVLLTNETSLKEIRSGIISDFLDVLEIPIPYFIQILVSESIREAENQGVALSKEVIERAYVERVLASYNRTYFEHYYTRLRDYYAEEEERLAKEFLLEIAKRGEVTRSELRSLYQNSAGASGSTEGFSDLLSDLENDFYVHFDASKQAYRFATKVLRDWWRRYYSIAD